jgi:large subunit ribosomal protein L15
MATRFRKVRHLRGSRTHGWGQIGQHRHSGSRGGTGMAGMHKHKWSYTVKYDPDHFGSNIFRPPNRAITNRWLNLSDLPEVVGDAKGEVDLKAMGYDKLLGQGVVSQKYFLKIERASASAVEKITSAGGTVSTSSIVANEQKEQASQQTPNKPPQAKIYQPKKKTRAKKQD